MIRKSPFLAVSLSLMGVTALLAAPARAQEKPTSPSDALPVRVVTLFSSGVSYTLRQGEVSGAATVPLLFRTNQINDILKSLVLLDENGVVQPAVYAAKDPIGRTLQAFAVDVTQPTSRAELLNRMRGARVAVETNNGTRVQGQVVGVETQTVPIEGGRTVTVEVLTVLGEAGLQYVRLDDVKSIRLLDERLDREFREALSLLAAGSDDKRRQVTLRFAGQGKRRVSVGYVSEAPLWKISYRLLIGGTEAGAATDKPYLQGWALVENTTDEDWNEVRLSLISGRPVSFIQDLYQPLYLPRPVVPPDVVAVPFPQVAEGNLDEERPTEAPAAPPPALSKMAAGRAGVRPGAAGGGAAAMRGDALSFAESQPTSNMAMDMAFRSSIVSEASGSKAGELFQYNIKTPVTLPRQQAAMIPVVAQDIDGEKVSVYNADTGPRFPLNAFRVKNNTPLHLKGGPVTLFDGGVYAGDARMEDVPPGDTRLVTYAVDLAVEGERQGGGSSTTETSMLIRRGVLVITRRERIETVYTLKNKAQAARNVLVEHPFRPEYKLLLPEKPAERTSDRYRFLVSVAPGKSEKLTVVAERPIAQSIGLVDAELTTLQVYANRKEISESLKNALLEVLRRRRRIQELQGEVAAAEGEIRAINEDQERVRKNMAALDKASALYKRYVTQLDTQETRIQALRTQSNRLRGAVQEADRELRAYVDTLDVTS